MTRALCLLLAVLTAIAAGCGGGGSAEKDAAPEPKDAYVAEFNKTSQTLERTLLGIREEVAARAEATPDQIAAKLEESAEALDDAAARLRRLTPPADAGNAHHEIVAGLRELARVFASGAEAAKDNDIQGLTSALTNIESSEGARRIKAAQDELRSKGYEVRTT